MFYTLLNILWILVLIKTVRLFRYYRIRLNLNSPADNEDERDKKNEAAKNSKDFSVVICVLKKKHR